MVGFHNVIKKITYPIILGSLGATYTLSYCCESYSESKIYSKCMATIELKTKASPFYYDISPDGSFLIAISVENRTVYLFNTKTGDQIDSYLCDTDISHIIHHDERASIVIDVGRLSPDTTPKILQVIPLWDNQTAQPPIIKCFKHYRFICPRPDIFSMFWFFYIDKGFINCVRCDDNPVTLRFKNYCLDKFNLKHAHIFCVSENMKFIVFGLKNGLIHIEKFVTNMPNQSILSAQHAKPDSRTLLYHIRVLQELKNPFMQEKIAQIIKRQEQVKPQINLKEQRKQKKSSKHTIKDIFSFKWCLPIIKTLKRQFTKVF